MSEYDDRSKWSDEALLTGYTYLFDERLYRKGEVRAALLRRMSPQQPEAGWVELTNKDEYAKNGDVFLCGNEPIFVNENKPHMRKIGEIIANSDANRAFRYIEFKCTKCGQFDIGQTGEYPCPKCGLPTTWDSPVRQEAQQAKQSNYKNAKGAISWREGDEKAEDAIVKTCQHCGGLGEIPYYGDEDTWSTCASCEGEGFVEVKDEEAQPEPEAPKEPELLPCPFCGGKAVFDISGLSGSLYRIMCNNTDICESIPATGWYGHKNSAIKAWNTRAPSPVQTAIEKAYNIACAQLGIAKMMLQKFADDCCYFSVQCDAEHALKEIAALDVKE